MDRSRQPGGVKSPPARRPPPTRPIAVGVVLVLLLFACGAWIAARSYGDLQGMVKDELELRFLTGRLLYLRGELAASARLAAATGESRWTQRYHTMSPEFESALRRIVDLAPPSAVSRSPTWAANAALAAAETRALELSAAGDQGAALQLLDAPDYEQRQQTYSTGLEQMATDILQRATERIEAQRRSVLAGSLVGLALLAVLAAAWAWISGLVQQYLAVVNAAELALANSNRDLERRVMERTAELSKVNAQLRSEMEQRNQAESSLRQAQKLEAVGRLASGVAHEINTPVQFVNDCCHFMRDGARDALQLLQQYRIGIDDVVSGAREAPAVQQALKADWQKLGADYLVEHMPESGDRAIEGLERIAQIVRSMKEYAHPGSRSRVPIDLNRAIDNALTISRNEYRYVADVHKSFAELPAVSAYAGELNQALLNLIVNAGHAIAEAVEGSDRRGRIDVSTRCEGGEVVIEIRDDGIGMPPAVVERIFDPFFTTKAVGKGSGQGLALVYSVIVEQHGGRIDVDSTPGKGTSFTIHLPLPEQSGADAPYQAA